MFSRSPVCLCGLVKKVVTCWERHLCLVFSKSHIQQYGFKRGETAKYLEVTRQCLPMLSRRCTCLANLWGTASPTFWLPPSLSFFMSLFLKPSLFFSLRGCGQLHVASSLEHFFALPMERNVHWSSSVHICRKGSGAMGGKKKKKERTISCSLWASKSKPTQHHNLPSALGHPSLGFS